MKEVKIIFIGDIVGRAGRKALAQILPLWIKKYSPDFVVANGENASHGIGITSKAVEELKTAGVMAITTGNHIWSRKEDTGVLTNSVMPVLRPANFPEPCPGVGVMVVENNGLFLTVANLQGRVSMPQAVEDPFRALQKIMAEKKSALVLVDFHAETTSEKMALGWLGASLGVTAIVGTHTHIPTNDARILENKTAYITDVGMTGPLNSVLGVDKKIIMEKFLTSRPLAHEIIESGPTEVAAVLITATDDGVACGIQILNETVEI